MDFGIAMLIAVFSPTIGLMAAIVGKPFIKSKTTKKLPLHICNIACVIGLIIYVSFLISMANGEHLNSVTTFKEYPIEKVTLSHVYFNDRDGDSFGESYVILEDPNDKYQNIVIVETEDYEIQWLFSKFKSTGSRYHVYLTDDIYKRLKDGRVIYEDKKYKLNHGFI